MWFRNLAGTRNIEGWGARVPGRLQHKPQETLMLWVGGPVSAPGLRESRGRLPD